MVKPLASVISAGLSGVAVEMSAMGTIVWHESTPNMMNIKKEILTGLIITSLGYYFVPLKQGA
jgi:hypothetical protein